MPQCDALLHIDTYPDPTSAEAIAQAVTFCAHVDAMATALAVTIDVQIRAGWLANHLAGVGSLAAAEEARSVRAAQEAHAVFQAKAAAAGVFGGVLSVKAQPFRTGQVVAEHARTRDFCIIPIVDRSDGQQSIAEDVVFGSGRPVIIFQPGRIDLPAKQPGLAVVAWDGSRAAARALADSLPICRKTREVHVLTIVNEKASAGAGVGAAAVRHLAFHGVNARAVEVDAAGRSVGAVLDSYVMQNRPDLLVMGAFGHSRLQEFILGGATQHVIDKPSAPLFLSH